MFYMYSIFIFTCSLDRPVGLAVLEFINDWTGPRIASTGQ